MMIPGLTKEQTQLVFIGAGIAAVSYFLLRRPVTVAAKTAGEAFQGELVAEDSPYFGTGPVGTVAAATNEVSGGLFQRLGSAVGGAFADLRDIVLTDTSGLTK